MTEKKYTNTQRIELNLIYKVQEYTYRKCETIRCLGYSTSTHVQDKIL